MPHQDHDRIARAAAVSSTGILAELALGTGAAGVVAGGLVPVAARAVGQVAAHIRGRQADKAGQALQVAADILDVGVDILDERVLDHDERVELLARVIEGSARSTFQEKIHALGRVLANGLRDDGDTDEALVFAAALAVVEAPHVVVLQHLGSHPHPPVDLVRPGIDSMRGWEASQLSRALPRLEDIMDGLLSVLAGQGLIRDTGGVTYPGNIGPAVWAITALGRRCLFLLDAPDGGPI